MRKASHLNDMAMAEITHFFKEGVTETDLAEQLKKIYRDLGADGLSFEPLFAFGSNAASGHHWPDDTRLKPGDCILVDIGCTWEGYCSDMTRTFFYKNVTQHQQEVYHTVLKANEEAEKAVTPGIPLSSLDQIARGIITDKGYGSAFTHRLGHFIGLEDTNLEMFLLLLPTELSPEIFFRLSRVYILKMIWEFEWRIWFLLQTMGMRY